MATYEPSLTKQGFSLVELSIVLVILGLLVGGIMTGQNLIKAAELRSVTTEFQQYQTAVNLFKEKYFALPGDMKNAGKFWGYATNDPAGPCTDAVNDEGTGTQTCDGSGDGVMWESFRFWEHLANAGLINGTFSGVPGGGGAGHSIIGENVPAAKYSNGGWFTTSAANNAGGPQWFAYDYGHYFSIGASVTNDMPQGNIFSPEEAWNIDTKVDDGMPAKGNLIARSWPTCTNAAGLNGLDSGGEDAVYALQTTSVSCALYFSKAY